jgi:DNA-binding transcriptional MerR regulator
LLCRAAMRDDEEVSGMEEVSIGEFARRSRLSVKVLRLYDELGVLIPARVDRGSGYRYYDGAQLESARLIAMLRQLQSRWPQLKTCSHAIRLMPQNR